MNSFLYLDCWDGGQKDEIVRASGKARSGAHRKREQSSVENSRTCREGKVSVASYCAFILAVQIVIKARFIAPPVHAVALRQPRRSERLNCGSPFESLDNSLYDISLYKIFHISENKLNDSLEKKGKETWNNADKFRFPKRRLHIFWIRSAYDRTNWAQLECLDG